MLQAVERSAGAYARRRIVGRLAGLAEGQWVADRPDLVYPRNSTPRSPRSSPPPTPAPPNGSRSIR